MVERDAKVGDGSSRTNSGGIWRLVWRGLRVSRATAIVLVLVASLAANAALFVGGVLYNVIDEALESVSGLATATGKQRKAADDLKKRNRHLVASNRKLRDDMTKARQNNRRLVASNRRLQDGMTKAQRNNRHLVAGNRRLEDDVKKARRNNRRLEDRMARLRAKTNIAVKSTVARSAKAAGRAVLTAPGKAVPYVGTAVVVGVTVLEIKDYCATIRDMKAIQREIDPSETHSEEEQRVCGMDIPTQEEILAQIKTVPLDAWQRSREFLTGLNPLTPEIETKLKTELDQWWNKTNRWLNQLQSVVE